MAISGACEQVGPVAPLYSSWSPVRAANWQTGQGSDREFWEGRVMGKGYTVNSPQTPSYLMLGLGAGLDSKKAFWGNRNIM